MKNNIFLKLLAFYKLLLRYNLHTYVPHSLTDKIVKSRFENRLYNVNGHQMYLNEGLFSLSLGEPFEPVETKIVKAIVKKGNRAVDLGANIGYYTLLLARQVGREGEVLAFEPNPINCKILEKNVKVNGYNNVKINQLAVADKSGTAQLQLTPNPADSRVRPDLDKGSKGKSVNILEIQTVSLDDYFCKKEEREIDFIKMDIQGAEYSAFLGMQGLLSKPNNIQILTEFFPKLLRESGTSPSDYLEILQKNGFNIYSIDEKDSKLAPASPSELLNKYPEQTDLYTNLLLTRENIGDVIRDLAI